MCTLHNEMLGSSTSIDMILQRGQVPVDGELVVRWGESMLPCQGSGASVSESDGDPARPRPTGEAPVGPSRTHTTFF